MIEDAGHTLIALVEGGEAYVVLLPIYVVLIVGERLAHMRWGVRPWDDRDAAANIVITVMFLGLDVLVGAVLPVAVFVWLGQYALIEFPVGGVGWLAAFVLYDLTWYVDHRLAHRVGVFWAFHHVHHSSREFNMTVASRGFILDNTLLTRPLFYALPLLGISPTQYVVVKIVTSVWGIAQHTRLIDRMPGLDAILATPSNHRVHHGIEAQYIDRNYGEVLMLWDHLFGTYTPEGDEPTYGVTESIDTMNPLRIEVAGLGWLARKMARSTDWRGRLACLYRPPDWTPTRRIERTGPSAVGCVEAGDEVSSSHDGR